MQIILLPGMDGTGLLFEPIIKELDNTMYIRALSYPGDIKKSYEELADEVIKQLPDKDEYVLVAESFSGPIAYLVASNAPRNLKAVVFLATFLTPPNMFMGAISMLPLRLLFKLPIPTCLIKSLLLGKGIESKIIDLFRRSLKSVKSSVLAYRVKEMSKLKSGKRPIEIPCVYVRARGDKLVSHYHANDFSRIASRLEIVELDGPHFIAQARPEECAKVVKKYATL